MNTSHLDIQPENRLIVDIFTEQFEKPTALEQHFTDLDGVRYYAFNEKKKRNIISLSIRIECWNELVQYGVVEVLQQIYGGMIDATPQPGFNLSLSVDVTATTDPEAIKELISTLSLLKRHAFSAPFLKAFSQQISMQKLPVISDGSPEPKGDLFVLHYREEEAVYIQAGVDKVTLIFSTVFREETDRVFGKVFLQEFVDARRLASIQSAPQVRYSNREPPLEIRQVPGLLTAEHVGYVTLVLFPHHFSTPALAANAISRAQVFRNYLHYHIKCSKAYMRSRMRNRAAEFLKVLNRARPESTGEKERKTVTGRTFKIRV